MMAGLPGSGKSSLVRQMCDVVDCIVISTDSVRAQLVKQPSYTLSEMQYMNIPVIATRVGSLAERVADGETGWLIEPTAEAYSELGALLETMDDKEQALNCFKAGLSLSAKTSVPGATGPPSTVTVP